MKILMSTIGSRGDVQPLLALALALETLGHSARFVVAPTFTEWVESLGFECQPIGPDVRQFANRAATAMKPIRFTEEQRHQLAVQTVREQFRVLADAARGCDLIVGATSLQIAARSIGEALRMPYVYVSYCPAALPSPRHPPARMGSHYPQSLPAIVNRFLWASDARSFDTRFRAALNEERAALGLPLVEHVRPYVFTNHPWLAADPLLGPAPRQSGMQIVQTGAWLLPDHAPLPANLERFLADGEPPIYFGFGSMGAPRQTWALLVDSARRVGRRAIVSRGWTDLESFDGGNDCIVIGDVNNDALFPRVAAAVHHGGAGTTTAVARAGKPQVVVPNLYDQYYWAHRVKTLGVGVSPARRERLTPNTLVPSLRDALRPEVAERARALGGRITTDGARLAAERVCADYT